MNFSQCFGVVLILLEIIVISSVVIFSKPSRGKYAEEGQK